MLKLKYGESSPVARGRYEKAFKRTYVTRPAGSGDEVERAVSDGEAHVAPVLRVVGRWKGP
jgi:hypothetical protein